MFGIWSSQVFLGLWRSNFNLCLCLPMAVSMCVCVCTHAFSCLIRTCSSPTLLQYYFTFNYICLQKGHILRQWGVRLQHIFGGSTIQPHNSWDDCELPREPDGSCMAIYDPALASHSVTSAVLNWPNQSQSTQILPLDGRNVKELGGPCSLPPPHSSQPHTHTQPGNGFSEFARFDFHIIVQNIDSPLRKQKGYSLPHFYQRKHLFDVVLKMGYQAKLVYLYILILKSPKNFKAEKITLGESIFENNF